MYTDKKGRNKIKKIKKWHAPSPSYPESGL